MQKSSNPSVRSVVTLPLVQVGARGNRFGVTQLATPSTHALTCGDPKVAKYAARMEHSHKSQGTNDEGALEYHERGLVVSEMAAEALPELGNTVDAADEDEDSGNEQAW